MAKAWGQILDKQAQEITDLSSQIGDNGQDQPSTLTLLTAASLKMQFMSTNSATSINATGQAQGHVGAQAVIVDAGAARAQVCALRGGQWRRRSSGDPKRVVQAAAAKMHARQRLPHRASLSRAPAQPFWERRRYMTPIQSIGHRGIDRDNPQVAGPQTQVQAYDVARFQEAYANAGKPAAAAPTTAIEPMSPGFKVVLQNFESLNGQVGNLGDLASSIQAGRERPPAKC